MIKGWVAIAVGLWIAGCGEAHPESAPPPGAAGQGAEQRPLTADEEAWAAESEFEIRLETKGCYIGCPVFDLRLRSTGDVQFTGKFGVWRPGTYEKQIPAKNVARLYQDMVRSGFLGFRESYVSQDDGCHGGDDFSTSTFGLRAAERQKQIVYYYGCLSDLPELPVLEALETHIVATAKIADWLKGDRPGCGFRGQRIDKFAPSYVLQDSSGQALGLLRVADGAEPMRSAWTVVSCDGEELARGESIGTWQCGSTLVPLNDTTMRWPGMDEPQSAVSVTSPIGMRQARPAQELELTLFTAASEQMQQAVVGDSCD